MSTKIIINNSSSSSSVCLFGSIRFVLPTYGLVLRMETRITPNMPERYEDNIIEFHSFKICERKETDYELDQIAHE